MTRLMLVMPILSYNGPELAYFRLGPIWFATLFGKIESPLIITLFTQPARNRSLRFAEVVPA